MAVEHADRWTRIRERRLIDPATRERYERTRRAVTSIRRVLQTIDAERERAGLTKAELAGRIGASPAAVRRLFTSNAANPTLRTILDLSGALDLVLDLRPREMTTTGTGDERPESSAGSIRPA